MGKPHSKPRKHGERAIEIASRQCQCGHVLQLHRGGECLVCDAKSGKFCPCRNFVPERRIRAKGL